MVLRQSRTALVHGVFGRDLTHLLVAFVGFISEAVFQCVIALLTDLSYANVIHSIFTFIVLSALQDCRLYAPVLICLQYISLPDTSVVVCEKCHIMYII